LANSTSKLLKQHSVTTPFHYSMALLTSVFKDSPLLKNIVETAMYFTVTAGCRGPKKGPLM
jgi:hypothetical protein